MTLDEYLRSDGCLTVAQLRAAIGAKSDAQIRQWQHGYAARLPSPGYCVAIERATAGAVTVEEMQRDHPWARVPDPDWPHPVGRPVADYGQQPAGAAAAEAA